MRPKATGVGTFNFLPGIFSGNWRGEVSESSGADMPGGCFRALQNVRHVEDAVVPRGGQAKLVDSAFTGHVVGIFQGGLDPNTT